MNLFSPFNSTGIVQLIEAHARSIKARINELESKQRRKTADNDEINELAIICDHNDFNVHQELIGIARTRGADFPDNISFLNHARRLLHQAHTDPAIVQPQDDSDIQVDVISRHSFVRTATLDSILFDLEHALLPEWSGLLQQLRSNAQPKNPAAAGSHAVHRTRPAARAFWVDHENVFPVPHTHIRYVLDHAGQFGFEVEQLRQEFRAAGEPIGFEGKARLHILTRAITRGWLRARIYERRAHHRSYLAVTLGGLRPNKLPLRILFCYLIEHKLIWPDLEVQIVDLGDTRQPLYSYPRLLGGAESLLTDMISGNISAKVN